MEVKWEEIAVIFGFYAIMKCTKRNERFCIRSKYVLIIEKWKRVRCVYVCVCVSVFGVIGVGSISKQEVTV